MAKQKTIPASNPRGKKNVPLTFGIIGLVFAVAGIILGLALLVIKNPVFNLIDLLMPGALTLFGVLTIVFSIVSVFVNIQVIKRKDWARITAIVFSIIWLILLIYFFVKQARPWYFIVMFIYHILRIYFFGFDKSTKTLFR